jgi:hypothetical protein
VSQRPSLTRFDLRLTASGSQDADLGSTGRCSTCKIGCQLYSGDSYHPLTCVFHNDYKLSHKWPTNRLRGNSW